MTNIRDLPDKWRKFKFAPDAETIGLLWNVGYIDCLGHVSDQLKQALPTWTRITEDTELPDNFMVAYKIAGVWVLDAASPSRIPDDPYIKYWWRPLCDLDYPPEETE